MIEPATEGFVDKLRAAHRMGWSIIPVGLDKRPMFGWKEYQERQPYAEELKEWMGHNAPAWAVITGAVSGIVIIDFDGEAGKETLESLALNPHVRTGSGGYHVYVEHPGHKVKTLNSKSKHELGERYPGLDIRADGGYAVFAGHNNSGPYLWLREMEPDSLEILPDSLRQFLGLELVEDENESEPELHTQAPLSGRGEKRVSPHVLITKHLSKAPVVGRNNAGFDLACQLRDNGYDQHEAETYMREFAVRVGNRNTKGEHEPYTAEEALTSCRQAYLKAPRRSWAEIKHTVTPPKVQRPEPKEFLGLIPEPSFLYTYTKYASDMTDSPPEFHLSVGLSILSAAVGNRIYFKAWGQAIYPNLWQVILAPSGFFRKSTAMRIGMNILGTQFRENILPNDFTKEKLIENLSTRAQGVIPVWEFGSLLKGMQLDYNGGLKEMLTELYDAPFYERQTKKGTDRIDKPALSILAASTIDWVIDRITSGDLNSGFLARFLYWPATKKNGWKGFCCETDPQHMEYLDLFLHTLLDVQGEVVFPNKIKHDYDKWLKRHEEEVNEQKLPAELQGFYTRISTYVLKFAVLYELAMTQDLEVTPEALDYAIRLAEYLKSHLVRLMEDEIAVTKDHKELKKVREIIEREPGIDRQVVLKKSHMTANRLNQLLDTLLQSGEVRAEKIETERRPKMLYYAE